MQHLADDIVEAESLWGNEVELLCEQMYESSGTGEMIWILEKFLCKKIRQQRKREKNLALQNALELMEGRRSFNLREIQERSEEHTSELQSLMRSSYAVFC